MGVTYCTFDWYLKEGWEGSQDLLELLKRAEKSRKEQIRPPWVGRRRELCAEASPPSQG